MNRTYINKNISCTTLKDGEIVQEKYGDSNSKFVSFYVENEQTVSFTNATFKAKTIHWGDNTITSISGGTISAPSHIYAAAANYCIRIEGCTEVKNNSTTDGITSAKVTKIEVGKGVNLSNYAFANLTNLKSINGLDLNENTKYICYGCTSLETVSFNGDTYEIGENCFGGCPKATILNNNLFKDIYIIHDNAFANNISVDSNKYIKLPKAQWIGSNVFNNNKIHIEFGRKDILFLHKNAGASGIYFYYPGTSVEFTTNKPDDSDDYRNAASKTGTVLFYNEVDPQTSTITAWHYVDGVPTAWPAKTN
jgi:hypothetical protein